MKKVFIGLLIIAAGAGAFYFLQKKKNEAGNTIQKELIVGKWKLDPLSVRPKDSTTGLLIAITGTADSNFLKYHYDFGSGGSIIQSLNDAVKAGTFRYEWTKKNELAWKENATDSSASELFTVTKLTDDSLLLLSKDSATFVFTKLK
jgi:hypothetical protein